MSILTPEPVYGSNSKVEPAPPVTSATRKPFLELFKEWAGVITIVITLFYTYPLGFWDRFVLTEQEREARAVEQVRNLVIQLAELDSEYMRTLGTIQDQNSKNGYTYAMTTRKSALVSRELTEVLKRYKHLTPVEIGLLANQFLVLGDGEHAKEMFDTATKGAAATKNRSVISEIYRLSAHQYLLGSPLGLNLEKARGGYQQAWEELRPEPQKRFALQAYSVLTDWSALEGNFGNDACALNLAKIAIPILQMINPSALPAAQSFVDSFKFPPVTKCPYEVLL